MNDNHSRSGVESFVDELLQTTGQMMLIVDHMARCSEQGALADDADPVDVVLRRLFTDVLEPGFQQTDVAALEAAGALLATAREVVGRELLLVEPPGSANGHRSQGPNRAARRRRRRR